MERIQFAALTVKEVTPTVDDVLAESGVQRRRFTVEEYHRLAEVGILREGDRVGRLNRELTLALGRRAFLWPQNPVQLFSDTEPQPDVVILRERPDDDAHAPAHPHDALTHDIVELYRDR
jgi:hypothetical protein